MAHGSIRLFLLVATAALAGCSSTPPVRYHTLMPAELPVPSPAASSLPPIAIVVEPVRVPAQVDQPQWLVRLADGGMALLEQDRWASALGDEFRLALREQLIAGHGATEARPAAGSMPIRVGVDVRRFDSVASREARTEGTWTLTSSERTGARSMRCEWFLREPTQAGTMALAAAHRRAVARLGDAIGEALRQLSRNEPATCPARDGPA